MHCRENDLSHFRTNHSRSRNIPVHRSVYRVLDANCNRLREALRVIEEYFRFIVDNKEAAVSLKELRHRLVTIENGIGHAQLLDSRNSTDDCFADRNRPEEMIRTDQSSVLHASFKRAQEAARVIEEYVKLTDTVDVSEMAKKLRFALYTVEKQFRIE